MRLRTAYLPNNREGRSCLARLTTAFARRLLFRVGESLTHGPGSGYRVVWSDIHLKTHTHGSPYGFPDTLYLQRLSQELQQKHVV